jgi:hypothetical protein
VFCSSCSPIFAEIVPEKSRTSIYALDRSFESVLSSFAPPIVGLLAERVYGYRPNDKGESVEQDRGNAASLAKALYTSIAIPFIVCTAIYSFLYCSYPRFWARRTTAKGLPLALPMTTRRILKLRRILSACWQTGSRDRKSNGVYSNLDIVRWMFESESGNVHVRQSFFKFMGKL